MSTVQLRRKRRWDITSNFLHHAEGVAFKFRSDVQTLVRQWVREGKIIEDVAEQLLRYRVDDHQKDQCLSSATTVTLEDCIRCSNIVNENEHDCMSDSQALRCYTFCQPNNSHGAYPPPLVAKSKKTLWFIQLATCVSPRLCRSFVESNLCISLNPDLKFLCKVLLPIKTGNKSTREAYSTNSLRLAEESIERIMEKFDESKVKPTKGTSFLEAGDFLEKVCNDVSHLRLKKRSELCSSFATLSHINVNYVVVTAEAADGLRNKSDPRDTLMAENTP